MAPLARVLSVCALFLLSNSSPVFGNLIHRRVMVGDSVTFPFGENCEEDIEIRWIHRQQGDTTRPVAVLNQEGFEAAVGYEGRIKLEPGGNRSLIFTRTIYNDKGSYACTCGSRVLPDVILDIDILYEKSVFEGQTVALKCYPFTASVSSIRWERDGKLVFELDVASGNVSYGPGFERRVSVSGYREGDLSLRLTGVQQEDQGDYCCYTGKDRERGNPAAVRLIVNKGEEATWTRTEVIRVSVPTAVAALIVGALLGMLFCWWLKSRSNVSTGGAGSPQIPRNMEMSNLRPNEHEPLNSPAVNGGASQLI